MGLDLGVVTGTVLDTVGIDFLVGACALVAKAALAGALLAGFAALRTGALATGWGLACGFVLELVMAITFALEGANFLLSFLDIVTFFEFFTAAALPTAIFLAGAAWALAATPLPLAVATGFLAAGAAAFAKGFLAGAAFLVAEAFTGAAFLLDTGFVLTTTFFAAAVFLDGAAFLAATGLA
jgi:hypothetical protein